MGKNVHPEYSTGIRTHDLQNITPPTSGQSYKDITILNYDSRLVVPMGNFIVIATLESVITLADASKYWAQL